MIGLMLVNRYALLVLQMPTCDWDIVLSTKRCNSQAFQAHKESQEMGKDDKLPNCSIV